MEYTTYYWAAGTLSTLFFIWHYRKDGSTPKKMELYWAAIGPIIFPILWVKFFFDKRKTKRTA